MSTGKSWIFLFSVLILESSKFTKIEDKTTSAQIYRDHSSQQMMSWPENQNPGAHPLVLQKNAYISPVYLIVLIRWNEWAPQIRWKEPLIPPIGPQCKMLSLAIKSNMIFQIFQCLTSNSHYDCVKPKRTDDYLPETYNSPCPWLSNNTSVALKIETRWDFIVDRMVKTWCKSVWKDENSAPGTICKSQNFSNNVPRSQATSR